MALEDAGQGSFGEGQDHEDLRVGPALAAEFQELRFELGWGFARLAQRHGGTVFQAVWGLELLGALEPFADGFLGDPEGGGGRPQRGTTGAVMLNQFGSPEWCECGISVHVVLGV
jgi:hypothetical protein